jgi:hypothetical protein
LLLAPAWSWAGYAGLTGREQEAREHVTTAAAMFREMDMQRFAVRADAETRQFRSAEESRNVRRRQPRQVREEELEAVIGVPVRAGRRLPAAGSARWAVRRVVVSGFGRVRSPRANRMIMDFGSAG